MRKNTRNQFLQNGTKHRDVSAALARLTGVVSIQEIIDAILGIDNFQQKTLKGIIRSIGGTMPNAIALSELYVDMTYQRRIRLTKIINKLRKHGGFSQDGAGTIDVAERPDGRKMVWDGFRRCLKGRNLWQNTYFTYKIYPSTKFNNDSMSKGRSKTL